MCHLFFEDFAGFDLKIGFGIRVDLNRADSVIERKTKN